MPRLLLLPLMLICFAAPVTVQAEDFTPEQIKKIESMFENYIQQNGKLIVDSVEKYQIEQQMTAQRDANKRAKEFAAKAVTDKILPSVGNKNGDITIIEFFDYNCGYCRKALEAIQEVMKKDDQVKVLFLDMPILGPSSLEASKWSLAAQKQDKYFEFHQEVMEHRGQKTESVLTKIAKDLELDIDELKKDKDSQEIADMLQSNVDAAQAMNIRGTPGFIINGTIYPGYMPAARILDIIKNERAVMDRQAQEEKEADDDKE